MKRKNFNPKNYYKLNNLRKKVINDISKTIDLQKNKLLEIGTGTGAFATLLAKKYKTSYIYAIDIVKSYVEYARKKNWRTNINFDINDIHNIKSTFDGIFMVFSLTELLKKNTIEQILKALNKKILNNGYLIIVDEFEDDYSEQHDLLGLKVLKSLGYKYLNYDIFNEELSKSNFDLIYTKVYNNKQNITNVHGSKLQIFYENKLNEYDRTKKSNSQEIWNKHKKQIEKLGGIRTYNTSRLIILKKKNNLLSKLNNIKIDLCLYYSLEAIENNIKYYHDLPINNLEYVFPVKTFPNNTIINLFHKYNFYYDASHEKEDELVKKYKTIVFYSDPTRQLKNNNSIRLNIDGLTSHFGYEYDNKSYEVYHIHSSMLKTKKFKNLVLKEISKLDFSKTRYLNIGGGYDHLSYLELKEYIGNIRKIVPEKVKILLEAGSLWFKDSGYLITKVKHISNIRGLKFAYLNACRAIHCQWSVPTYMNKNRGKEEYIICGSSCDEGDLFAHVYNTLFKVGDKVYFSKIEPYSYSFNTSFNGIEKAEVIIDE